MKRFRAGRRTDKNKTQKNYKILSKERPTLALGGPSKEKTIL